MRVRRDAGVLKIMTYLQFAQNRDRDRIKLVRAGVPSSRRGKPRYRFFDRGRNLSTIERPADVWLLCVQEIKRAQANKILNSGTQGIRAMLTNPQPIRIAPFIPFGKGASHDPAHADRASRSVPARPEGRRPGARGTQSGDLSSPTVDVAPYRAVTRRGTEWRGMGAEVVQATAYDRVDYGFRSSPHLLAAYDQGVRLDGESYVEGVPRSTLRDVARKLTFAPAGHEYREWHDPRTLTAVTYFYFDPATLQTGSESDLADVQFMPRLFFEDATIWSTVAKLKRAIEVPDPESRLYVEALGVVLVHELIRLNRGAGRVEAVVRGGLAGWQQRIVTSYIDEHLSEPISLATLAQLVRLSTYYFCRAFKQSFGVPPHRYHMNRRIEEAKALLASRKHSVTEVALTLGFCEASAFTAAFRKTVGQTPSSYYRSLA
jgi:AraC family transcriptional regulator